MNTESEEPETDLVEPEDFVDPVPIDEWQVSITQHFLKLYLLNEYDSLNCFILIGYVTLCYVFNVKACYLFTMIQA